MEPKTTKKPSRKLVVFKRELPFYLMLIIFFPLPLTLPIPTFYFLIPNCSNFSPCFLTPNFSRRFPMAHTLLFSGYGAPGCDDLAVCRLTADGMLDCVYELDGHMRVLNHDGCTVSTVQASTVPKPRSWPGGACATADGTLFVSNRGPNSISAWQRPYRNRQPCAAWCFLRAGAGLIFVIVFSLFLIFTCSSFSSLHNNLLFAPFPMAKPIPEKRDFPVSAFRYGLFVVLLFSGVTVRGSGGGTGWGCCPSTF